MSLVFHKSIKLGKYIAHMKIREVPPDDKRPDGFKVNFVLVDTEAQRPVILVDNHEPFGYHLHPTARDDHRNRIELSVTDPYDALDIFLDTVKEITDGK